jgi:hypothetical protein
MRLSYAIKFEDFRTLQAPFPTAARNNLGFKGVLVACVLIAALGVFCIAQGMGLPVGGFLIGLGLLAAAAAFFYEQRSVRTSKEKYDKKLAEDFQRIHCRDQRVFVADENGFTSTCNCGTVTRPWSALTSFSENKTHFAFKTNMGGQVLPKSAFASEAEITQFRALATGMLNHDRPVTAPHFDFALKREEYRAAYWLHTLKGGGWRDLAKAIATYAGVMYGGFVIWNSIAGHNDAVRAGLMGALIAVPLVRILKKRRGQYLGPLRVHFSDEGLYLQDPANQSRISWKQFVGYLDGSRMMLLYYNPRLYRIIPKRVLTGQATKFQTMAQSKLKPYDYRNPSPAQESTVTA